MVSVVFAVAAELAVPCDDRVDDDLADVDRADVDGSVVDGARVVAGAPAASAAAKRSFTATWARMAALHAEVSPGSEVVSSTPPAAELPLAAADGPVVSGVGQTDGAA